MDDSEPKKQEEELEREELIKETRELLDSLCFLQHDAAKQVFDAVLAFTPNDREVIKTPETANQRAKLSFIHPSRDALNKAIHEHLNARTMGYFLELIQANHQSAKQASRALKRHSENHAIKAQVFDWLGDNRRNFSSMDKTAQALTKVVPMGFRTLQGWVSEWHKLQPPSTQ